MKDSNTLYGYIFSLSATKFFLQATTWLFGYSVARVYLEASPVAEAIAAALFGLVLSSIIDGPLSLLLEDLLQPGSHPAYKWALAVGFSALTGSTTLVSGFFLGEAKRAGLGSEDRQEILSEARESHSARLASLTSDLEGIEGRIAELQQRFRRDTALIISNMTPNHRMLYRAGKHKPYLKSSTTLRENTERISALSTALQLELSSLKGRRYTISKARDQVAAADPEAAGKEKIAGIDAKNRKMGDIVSGAIYVVDIVAILLTWAIFFLIRDKAAAGAKLDIETSSSTRWLLDRAAILQNKLLSAFSGADDEIADAARMFISIPVGLIQLLAWCAGIAALALTAPLRLYRPRPLGRKAKPVAPPPDLEPTPAPMPVRLSGQFDSWEAQRRIEMQEARIEMIRQEQERREAESRQRMEVERRQLEERARQEVETQRRQIEEESRQKLEEQRRQVEADRLKLSEENARQKANLSEKKKGKQTGRKTPEPLSDKESGKVSAKVVGNEVQFDGKSYNLSELSKLTDYAATVYHRQFTLGTPKGRQKNADRWRAIEPVLKGLGYEIKRKEGNRISITGGKKIQA